MIIVRKIFTFINTSQSEEIGTYKVVDVIVAADWSRDDSFLTMLKTC